MRTWSLKFWGKGFLCQCYKQKYKNGNKNAVQSIINILCVICILGWFKSLAKRGMPGNKTDDRLQNWQGN